MKLSSGSEIVVDLTKISIKEWREMWDLHSDDAKSDEIFGRCVGMSLDEVQALNFRDFQQVGRAIREAASQPLEDPKNLASAST
jgi:hypothetical protein